MTSAEKRAIAPILRFVAKSNPEGLGAVAQTILDRVQRQPRVARSQRGAAVDKRTDAAKARQRQRKVYAEVDKRSGGVCEQAFGAICCLNDATEHDHFWGRGKAEESVENVWHLCKFHHDNKTANDPSRAHWIQQFRRHCYTQGFREQMALCDRALSLEFAQHPESRAANTVQPEPDREPTNAG